jgi:hypothetical protein
MRSGANIISRSRGKLEKMEFRSQEPGIRRFGRRKAVPKAGCYFRIFYAFACGGHLPGFFEIKSGERLFRVGK